MEWGKEGFLEEAESQLRLDDKEEPARERSAAEEGMCPTPRQRVAMAVGECWRGQSGPLTMWWGTPEGTLSGALMPAVRPIALHHLDPGES